MLFLFFLIWMQRYEKKDKSAQNRAKNERKTLHFHLFYLNKTTKPFLFRIFAPTK